MTMDIARCVTCNYDTYLKMRMSAPTPMVVMRVRQVPTLVAYAATLGLPAPSSLETLQQATLDIDGFGANVFT